MEIEDIEIGKKVQFIKIVNGKRKGVEKEIYTIIDINFKQWESCNIKVANKNMEIFTNNESVELCPTNITYYEQLYLF